jgi:hypothetical protein
MATLVAAAIAFSATACGGDSDNSKKPSGSSSSAAQGSGSQGSAGPTTDPNSQSPIATIKGDSGIDMVIHQAKRDDGGFVTINGEFKNTGSEAFTTPSAWSGTEQAIQEAAVGPSLAAMTLVDSKGKKRYYVLRDTDNRPLTTTGYEATIDPGTSMTFYAQFPSPPTSTTTVDIELPGFPNSSIEIS